MRKTKAQIQLSDHFSYGRLLRFTLPSIGMSLFTSIYSIVDGLFVSNIAGKTAFASVNLIIPYLMILGGVGAMLGVGGSALVAKTLGEGDIDHANRFFTMMMYLMLGTSVFCTVVGIAVLKPVAYLFGATEHMIHDVMVYGTICLLFNTALQAQYTFQSYLIVAEKPKFALGVIVAAGLSNMVLDWLFIMVFKMGVAGAALATGLSQCIAAIVPFIWFLSKRNTSVLHFAKTKFEFKSMLKACGNGASEMLNSVSGSITGILYNWQLMKYAGEDGVAAYGVVMYAAFIFISVYAGYSQGVSPIMGFHYGAQNHAEMKNVLKRSHAILTVTMAVLTAIALIFARPIAKIFVGYDADLLEMTVRAFVICSIPFAFMWFNSYTSGFFTSLNDGAVSAAISVIRSLILPVLCVIILPMIWGLDGIWYSLDVGEALCLFVTVGFMLGKKKKYNY